MLSVYYSNSKSRLCKSDVQKQNQVNLMNADLPNVKKKFFPIWYIGSFLLPFLALSFNLCMENQIKSHLLAKLHRCTVLVALLEGHAETEACRWALRLSLGLTWHSRVVAVVTWRLCVIPMEVRMGCDKSCPSCHSGCSLACQQDSPAAASVQRRWSQTWKTVKDCRGSWSDQGYVLGVFW